MSASSARNGPRGERRRAPLAARRPAPAPATTRPPPRSARPPEPAGLRDSDGEWMTMGAAAEAAGVSPGTVRRWRKEGTIAERKAPGDRGGVEVFLTADSRRQKAAERDAADVDHDHGPHSELGVLVPLEIHQRSLAELILRLTDTTERAVRAESRVEVLEAQLAELRPTPTRPAGTLPSPPPRRRK